MTIRFILPGDIDTPTGGYRYDRSIVRHWQSADIAHEVVSLEGGFPFPGKQEVEGSLRQISDLAPASSTVIDGLAGGASSEIMEALAKQAPVTALIHHPLCLENGLSETEASALKLEEQNGLAFAKEVITTSHATARTVQEIFNFPQERIRTVLPGVDRGVISQPPTSGPARLICVGSVIERKGHENLISALSELTELNWTLECYGATHFDPELFERMSEMIGSSSLSDRIRFHGAVSESMLEIAYQNAHIFVLASHYEGYGMAYAEAIVRGLPVIGTTAGAIPDTVPTACGILVEPGNVNALKQALATMIEDQKTRQTYREAAIELAPSFPTWEASALQFAKYMGATS